MVLDLKTGRPLLYKRPEDHRFITIDVSGKMTASSIDSVTSVEATHLRGGDSSIGLTISSIVGTGVEIEFIASGGSDGAFYLIVAQFAGGEETTLEATMVLGVTTSAEAG